MFQQLRGLAPTAQRVGRGIIVWLALLGSAHAEVPAAKTAYEEAVSALGLGDLARAKRGFLLAYIEAPRPIVLYNLALTCRDLEQPEQARAYFKQYLADPGVPDTEPTRIEASTELAKLEAAVPPSPPVVSVTPPAREASPPSAVDDVVGSKPQAAGTLQAPVSAAPGLVTPVPPGPNSAAVWKGASIGVGTLGAIALAAGVIVHASTPSSQAVSGERYQDGFLDGIVTQRQKDLRTMGTWLIIGGSVGLVGGLVALFTLGQDTQLRVSLDRVAIAGVF